MLHKLPGTTWEEDAAAVWNQAGLGLQRRVFYLEIKALCQTKRTVKIQKNKLSSPFGSKEGVVFSVHLPTLSTVLCVADVHACP